MGKEFPLAYYAGKFPRVLGIGTSLSIALVLIVLVVQNLMASTTAASLEGSTKAVDLSEAFPGQKVRYSIVISNSGDLAAQNVVMTDVVPSGLTLFGESLTYTLDSASVVDFGEENGVISWTGAISAQGSAIIDFQAILTDSLGSGDVIENIAWITGTGSLVTRTATTTIITSSITYLPVVFKPVPVPVLNPVLRTSSSNLWTVSWSDAGPEVTRYELQESGDMDFASPSNPIDMALGRSREFNPERSTKNLYCYRVRAVVGELIGGWSNTACVYGNYYDEFDDPSSGWAIRRQDTDDVENRSYYEDGHFVPKIGGRWDYALAAPMVPAPWSSYEIETMVKLEGGIDNLHTYGIVFGGDWDGRTCPNSDYSSCFNRYYRLQVVWYGASKNTFKVDLKRIDYHDPNDNVGRGTFKLISFEDFKVGNASGWNKWTVKVHANGLIEVFVNDQYVGGGIDPSYNGAPYFGVFAASNEYSGTEPWYEWYRVRPLP